MKYDTIYMPPTYDTVAVDNMLVIIRDTATANVGHPAVAITGIIVAGAVLCFLAWLTFKVINGID
jgi:hypothetical protein